MKRVKYPAEFKAEAVKQVTERGHPGIPAPESAQNSKRPYPPLFRPIFFKHPHRLTVSPVDMPLH